MKITTKHASNSPVTFVTQQRFAVLLRKLIVVNTEVYTVKTVCTPYKNSLDSATKTLIKLNKRKSVFAG